MKKRTCLRRVTCLILGLMVAQWGCGGKMSEETAQKMVEKGFQQQEKGNHAQALEIYSQVVKKNPQLTTGYVYRAMLYESMNENQKALADFQKVIELDPTDFYSAQQIANIYRKMGDTAKADEADRQAQKVQQNSMEQTRHHLENSKKKKPGRER